MPISHPLLAILIKNTLVWVTGVKVSLTVRYTAPKHPERQLKIVIMVLFPSENVLTAFSAPYPKGDLAFVPRRLTLEGKHTYIHAQ